MIIALLIIIAIGVLLISEVGRNLLALTAFLGLIGLALIIVIGIGLAGYWLFMTIPPSPVRGAVILVTIMVEILFIVFCWRQIKERF